MAPQPDSSRHCAQCGRDIHSTSDLDATSFARLVASADGSTCARFELSDGRPRLAGGALASALVVALAGCGTAGSVAPAHLQAPSWAAPKLVELAPGEGAQLTGQVRDRETHAPIEGLAVMLEGPGLAEALITFTDKQGGYGFVHLDGGSYTLTLGGQPQSVELPAGSRTVLAVDHRPITILLGGIYSYDEEFAEPGPHLIEAELEIPER